MEASVGNLIAEGNKEKTLNVFYELLCIRYFLAGVCSISLYFMVSPFISVWLGDKYILPQAIIILLSAHIFIQQARLTVDNFKNGYGIYQDVWAPIAEVVLYLGLAVILGHFYGLAGILGGMVISEALIKMIWKPYYLFLRGFEVSVWKYYWPGIFKYLLAFCLCMILAFFFSRWYRSSFLVEGWIPVLLYCLIMGILVAASLSVIFLVLDRHFLGFAKHLLGFIKNR